MNDPLDRRAEGQETVVEFTSKMQKCNCKMHEKGNSPIYFTQTQVRSIV